MLYHHLANEDHKVCLSFADLSFWCYACDSYVTHPSLEDMRKKFEAEKFPDGKLKVNYPLSSGGDDGDGGDTPTPGAASSGAC